MKTLKFLSLLDAPMHRRTFLAAAVLISDWLSGVPATATERDPPPDRCLPIVQQEIDRIALPPSRIDRIQISRQVRQIRGFDRTTGFDGWVRLNDCPGSLVVDMDTNCRVRQVYSAYSPHGTELWRSTGSTAVAPDCRVSRRCCGRRRG